MQAFEGVGTTYVISHSGSFILEVGYYHGNPKMPEQPPVAREQVVIGSGLTSSAALRRIRLAPAARIDNQDNSPSPKVKVERK